MKKLIALCLVVALGISAFGPALTEAVITTGLNRGTGGGTKPIVKVKWEMKDTMDGYDKWLGEDDSTAAGAQFAAPGVWDGTMDYVVCAVVTDPNGITDISGVYADIYYPTERAIHDLSPSTDLHPDAYAWTADSGKDDEGEDGCGAFIEQNTLIQLSKADGYQLFCERIHDSNNNLPQFYSPYTYDEICAVDGELMKEEAYVYCDVKELIWEDPAGFYKVVVTAQDKAGNNSTPRENHFEYLPLTAYQADFTNINYGQVLLSTRKKISGDKTWGTASYPTVRNLGNTRLSMWVAQDDMGLGQSSGLWNVEYDARVGNHEADWVIYNPFGPEGTTPSTYTQLEDVLDLSEVEEMDFSIHVKKWPDANTSYTGNMWLDAQFAPFRVCDD